MSFLYYIFSFFIIINLIVFAHEFGHYFAARKIGVKITTFSIGMGPELFGFDDKNGTRWCFSLLPIGGYVMMLGDGDVASATEDAESIKDLSEDDKKQSIICKNNWEKMLVAFAGPFFNYVYAFIVLFMMGVFYGVPNDAPIVGDVLKGSPAETAGFLSGDKVCMVDGKAIDRFRDILVHLSNSDLDKHNFEIDRSGQHMSIDVVPKITEKNRLLGGVKRTKLIGLQSAEQEFKRLSIINSFKNAFNTCVATTVEMIKVFSSLFAGRKSLDDFGGIVHMASMAGKMSESGNFAMLIMFTVTLSLNLGFINLFPLPVLDGGRILLCFIEQVIGRKLNEKFQEYIMLTCALLLILLMLVTTVNDVLRIEAVSKFVSGVLG